MSLFSQCFYKIDEERSLNDVIRMGWEGRSNDANVHE
jgi:hypothetical protein